MNADIVERIRSDFPPAQAEEVLILVDANSKRKGYGPSPRIVRCILYLARGDVGAFKERWQEAEEDYRNVIMAAEYDSFHIQLRDFNQPFGSEIVPNPLAAEWRSNQSNQPAQHNAGSRAVSNDSPESEIPSAAVPRG